MLSVLAPLGTDATGLPLRAVFWIGLTLAGGIGAWTVKWALDRWARRPLSVWLTGGLQSLGATAAVAPFVILGLKVAPWSMVAVSLFYIWVISAVITTVGMLVALNRDRADGRPGIPTRPPLMDRLPMSLRDATLYAVSSEDHYARVRTSAGDHLMLLRLADVPDLARPVEGLSPHRSWWVAEGGVADVSRTGGRIVLRLHDGTEVPVSRAGAKRVREAGWLP